MQKEKRCDRGNRLGNLEFRWINNISQRSSQTFGETYSDRYKHQRDEEIRWKRKECPRFFHAAQIDEHNEKDCCNAKLNTVWIQFWIRRDDLGHT